MDFYEQNNHILIQDDYMYMYIDEGNTPD